MTFSSVFWPPHLLLSYLLSHLWPSDLSYDLLTSWLSDLWPLATLWVARSLKHITHDRSPGEEWWLVYTDPVDVVVCVWLLYVVRWVDVDCGVWLDNHLTDIRVTLSTNIDAQFYHKDTRWHDQQPSQREGRMNYPSHLCQVRAVVNTIEEVEGELYFPFPSPLLMSLPISSPLRFASSPGRCRSFSHVPHCCATSILRVCGKRRWDISKFWVKDSQKVFTEISTMVDCFPEHLMETLISSYFRKVQIFSQTTIPSPPRWSECWLVDERALSDLNERAVPQSSTETQREPSTGH